LPQALNNKAAAAITNDKLRVDEIVNGRMA
jgi:hypothetical protein